MSAVTLNDICEAYKRIRPEALVTPLLTMPIAPDNQPISLKCEIFQPIGAFKVRGALNAMRQLSEDERASGVVTESSGNHAQAIAFAARILGIRAHIVMPHNAPEIKVRGVQRYGASIYPCEPNEQARREQSLELVKQTGGTLIHPFNNEHIIAGQGTTGIEILEQHPSVKTVLVPIGGGGLMSGIALAIKEQAPHVRVVGVEPEGAADALASIRHGSITPVSGGGKSIAEGLLTTVGEKTFEIIKRYVDEVVTVSERDIALATLTMFERAKLVVEPSGATAFAAVMNGKKDLSGADTVVVLTGGNIDTRRFPDLQTLAHT